MPEAEPSLLTLMANTVKGATGGAITYKAPPTTNLEADTSSVIDGKIDTSSSEADLFDITGDISITTKLLQHEHINTRAVSPSQGTLDTKNEQTNKNPKITVPQQRTMSNQVRTWTWTTIVKIFLAHGTQPSNRTKNIQNQMWTWAKMMKICLAFGN